MNRIFKLELSKAIKNPFFLFSIIFGCVITLQSFFYNFVLYQNEIADIAARAAVTDIEYNPQSATTIVFNMWVGGEGVSLGSALYFFVFPLLIAMAYGWSYCEEKSSGYAKSLFVYSGKRAYYLAKYWATFIAGGLAMIGPLIFNFLLSLLFFPAITPLVVYDIYYSVFGNGLMAKLYYTKPFLYVLCYLGIDFIYCGLLACLCLTATAFLKQKWFVVIVPFFLCLMVNYGTRFVYTSSTKVYKQISPFYFLRPASTAYSASWDVIIISAALLFLGTFLSCFYWERRREIY